MEKRRIHVEPKANEIYEVGNSYDLDGDQFVIRSVRLLKTGKVSLVITRTQVTDPKINTPEITVPDLEKYLQPEPVCQSERWSLTKMIGTFKSKVVQLFGG